MAKYTNAGWLYQNYFGEFNLPPSFKEQIKVELQMVANGFALTAAHNMLTPVLTPLRGFYTFCQLASGVPRVSTPRMKREAGVFLIFRQRTIPALPPQR